MQKAMRTMTSRLHPNERIILKEMQKDDDNEAPSSSSTCSLPTPKSAKLSEKEQEAERAAFEQLTIKWKKGGHGKMDLNKPDGVLHVSPEH